MTRIGLKPGPKSEADKVDLKLEPVWPGIPKELDKKNAQHRHIMVFIMAAGGATQKEIAEYIGLSQTSISNTYWDAYNQGRTELSMSIRRWQVKKARMLDTEMLKHLGKVYCQDQKEIKTEELPEGQITGNIEKIEATSLKEEKPCGNSAESKSTLSEILPPDITSRWVLLDQENP